MELFSARFLNKVLSAARCQGVIVVIVVRFAFESFLSFIKFEED